MGASAEELERENATLRAERGALRQAVAFFASVIKSGEPWSDVCEKTYQAVINGPQK